MIFWADIPSLNNRIFGRKNPSNYDFIGLGTVGRATSFCEMNVSPIGSIKCETIFVTFKRHFLLYFFFAPTKREFGGACHRYCVDKSDTLKTFRNNVIIIIFNIRKLDTSHNSHSPKLEAFFFFASFLWHDFVNHVCDGAWHNRRSAGQHHDTHTYRTFSVRKSFNERNAKRCTIGDKFCFNVVLLPLATRRFPGFSCESDFMTKLIRLNRHINTSWNYGVASSCQISAAIVSFPTDTTKITKNHLRYR